jgi:hypothetical protein
MTLSSQLILPKGFIKLQHRTLPPQSNYSQSCSNLPAEGTVNQSSQQYFGFKNSLESISI